MGDDNKNEPRHDVINAPPPTYAGPPDVDAHSGPALTARTLDRFLKWAATVPNSRTEMIKERIAEAKNDPELINELVEELRQRPITDVARQLLLLSTLGELRDERLVDALISFVWDEGPLFEHPEPPERQESSGVPRGDKRSLLDFKAVVQSRAVEMLAYLGTPKAVEATLEVAQKHPSAAVRIAAVDAHLFNHRDSSQAIEHLRKVVSADDAKLVGLPRFIRGMDVAEFEARASAFYERHVQERPAIPARAAKPPEARRWAKKGRRD